MPDTDPVSSVVAGEFKSQVKFIGALVAVVGGILFAIAYVQNFVDGRVALRMTEIQRPVEDHERRMVKLEDRFGEMKDTLAEIRADVRVLRAKAEPAEEGVHRAPAAPAPAPARP